MALGPWLLTLVGVTAGVLGVIVLAGQPTPASPFTAIVEAVMDTGGFGYFSGLLLLTASIAAIMSTADSLLIAVSQLVTSELFYRKSATRPPSRLRTRCWVAPVRS